jgi:predicted O-methyltransferase YrrM
VPWTRFGRDMIEGQAESNRALYLNWLVPEALAKIPDVHTRLSGPSKVADIGSGVGWSAVGIAQGYPQAEVDCFEPDELSVEMGRQNAASLGLAQRVRFHLVDAADPSLAGAYDLVAAFECIHDLPRPVEVLATMRRLAGEDGVVLVMDERVGEEFTAPADEPDRLRTGSA